MKKIFIMLFSIGFLFISNINEVNASEYNGPLGVEYTSTGTMFYYYTDKENVNVYVEITNESNVEQYLMEKPVGEEMYSVFLETSKATLSNEYRYKICDVSDPSNCSYSLDLFSDFLNIEGNKNVIVDTNDIDAQWGNVVSFIPSDYQKSIYALDASKFVKNIDTPAGEKLTYSVFDKMVLSAQEGSKSVGIDYLRGLGFSYIEVGSLYDADNYLSVNREYSNKEDEYSALKEYQTMLLKFKTNRMNLVLRTNFTNVSPILKETLLNVSETAVVNDKLNYSDYFVQRYIKEVYAQWVKEYNVDGFYIEDADLYEDEFLTSLISYIASLEPGLFIYTNEQSEKYYTSDKLQELLIGSLTSLDNAGIVNGYYTEENMLELYNALFTNELEKDTYTKAGNVINNFGSLKGLDVYSKVKATAGLSSNDTDVKNKIKLVLYSIYSSAGIPRVVAGNEFLNTTIVDGNSILEDRICITSSICYALDSNKEINWDHLIHNENIVKLMVNYRPSYYYQYPSLYTLKNVKSITLNEEYLKDGLLFITFNYNGSKNGEILRSLYIVNYSNSNVILNKISELSYTSVSSLLGKVSESEGKTVIASNTFYVYTEVKEVNIPQWLYLVVGVGLIGLIIGIRQLLVYLLKKKRGIEYKDIKPKRVKKAKPDNGVREESIFETFLFSDPLVKRKKEEMKNQKAKKETQKAEEKKIEDNKKEENEKKD